MTQTISQPPAVSAQEFCDTVRERGVVQHWNLHCGLSWLASRFENGKIVAESADADALQAAITSLLALPGKTERAAISAAALVLLKKYGAELPSSDYAAIWMQLRDGGQ